MLEAVDWADYATVTSLAHDMRGSGGSFGFQAISDLSAGLEKASGDIDVDRVRKRLSELSSYLKSVAIAV